MAKLLLGRLVITAAVLSIAASLIPLAADGWWIAELFSHFRLQYLGSQLLLVLALSLLGRGRWCLALLPALALNAVALWPYLPPATPAHAEAGAAPLKLVAVNVSARNRAFDELVAMLAAEAPDLVLVTEYTPAAAAGLAALAAHYPYGLAAPKSGAFGIALLSRLPLEGAKAMQLDETLAIDAQVQGPSGPFRVLGVHLLAPTSVQRFHGRNRQLEHLAELSRAGDGPLIVLGDFNVSPYSPYFKRWLAASGLTDTLQGRGPAYTWPAYFPLLGIPIDHCAVSADFAVQARRSLAGFGSDHFPILVELYQDPAQ